MKTSPSDLITFFAPGEPKGQPRPRAFARKMGGKYVARVFDAGTAEGWKAQVALAAKPHRPPSPLTGPLAVELWFHFPRPKAHYRGGNPHRGLRPDAPHWHTGKPDGDNLAKAVLDALTQIGAFWRDDSQVAYLTIRKGYSETPGCSVAIRQLESGEAFP